MRGKHDSGSRQGRCGECVCTSYRESEIDEAIYGTILVFQFEVGLLQIFWRSPWILYVIIAYCKPFANHYSLPLCIVSSSRMGERDRGAGGTGKVLWEVEQPCTRCTDERLVVSCSSNCAICYLSMSSPSAKQTANPGCVSSRIAYLHVCMHRPAVDRLPAGVPRHLTCTTKRRGTPARAARCCSSYLCVHEGKREGETNGTRCQRSPSCCFNVCSLEPVLEMVLLRMADGRVSGW